MIKWKLLVLHNVQVIVPIFAHFWKKNWLQWVWWDIFCFYYNSVAWNSIWSLRAPFNAAAWKMHGWWVNECFFYCDYGSMYIAYFGRLILSWCVQLCMHGEFGCCRLCTAKWQVTAVNLDLMAALIYSVVCLETSIILSSAFRFLKQSWFICRTVDWWWCWKCCIWRRSCRTR